ncbi:hypothetical protein FRC17_009892 [Serendipita sp. 399]|nr:hypothetical protein FRC17_009892 [Serendipita sp. 399]
MSSPVISHMPALKVGGRRLSVSNRAKHARSASKDVNAEAAPKEGEASSENAEASTNNNNNEEEEAQQEEEQGKKKRPDFTPDHAIKRDTRWIDNTPKNKRNNSYGGAGRIGQPAGKTVPS